MPDEPKKPPEQPPRIGAKRASIPPPPPKRPSLPPQQGAKRSSVPPPPPTAWSRPRDDQRTEENLAAGHDVSASIRTAEMPSASEAVTEKIDHDDLRNVRASREGAMPGVSIAEADGPIVPAIPQADIKTEVDGPIIPKIPGEELKTDVMAAPPDFGDEVSGKTANPGEPLKVPGNALVTQAFELRNGALPPRAQSGIRKWVVAALIALAAVGVLVSIFWVRR